MKRFLSKAHANYLKRIYMKTGFDHPMMVGIHNRKVALYDILAEREQLPQMYHMDHSRSRRRDYNMNR